MRQPTVINKLMLQLQSIQSSVSNHQPPHLSPVLKSKAIMIKHTIINIQYINNIHHNNNKMFLAYNVKG